ncbi:MAG: LAGLIDADG family homing endonuclease [archaeon]
MEEWNALKERNKLIAEEILERNDFVVVSHHDADGLCAGSIMAKALERKGKKFTQITSKQLYSDTIREIKSLGKNFVFVDFGSGQINLLEEFIKENFFVIDHHQPIKSDYLFHSNPFLFGFDGGTEISGAGMTYLVAKEIDEKNKDLSALAIVGAVGDMQDYEGKLTGLNRKILEDAEETGLIKKENDLILYGKISRPLTQFLSFSSNPVFPGLAANDKASAEFILKNGIQLKEKEKWRVYSDLSKEEKKVFASALVMHLIENGCSEEKAKKIFGETYTLLKENPKSPLRDAKEYATLLNSCLVPGTEVYLNGTPTKIEEISSKNVFSVENNKIVRDKILKKHKIPLPKGVPIIELISNAGRSISLTPNHELMSVKEGNRCWVTAEKLKEGDYIAISKNIPDISVKLKFDDFFKDEELVVFGNRVRLRSTIKTIKKPAFNKNLGFLTGYIAGDGHLKKSVVNIAFSRNKKDLFSFKLIKKTFKEQFGVKKISLSNKKNFFNAEWSSKTLSDFFNRLGINKGKKTNSVCFDEKLLNGNKEFVSGLLSGLFASDGNVYSGGVEFSSHSSALIKQMTFLLQRFGIVAHNTSRKCADCEGQKNRLIVCGKPNIKKFLSGIGFPDKERNDFLKSIIRRNSGRASGSTIPIREKILGLGKLLGISVKWSSHFTYYSKGKNPLEENATKFAEYYLKQILKCKKAISKRDIKLLLNAFRISVTKFSAKGGISREWVSRILKGKVPGKNAQKKIEDAFEYYSSIINEAEKLIQEINLFVESDIHWDKIKNIKIKTKELPEFVYDVSVEKNHNYIANGIVVHNCGRHGQAEVGLKVCMGDRTHAYQNAMELLLEHRKQLREGITWVHSNGVQEEKAFYFFDAGKNIKEEIVGIIAGMLYGSRLIEQNKPVIAFAKQSDELIKVSARATDDLVRKGLNLGKILKETCIELGSDAEGGGHKIAAGCRINSWQQNEFKEKLNKKISESIKL